MNHAAHLFLADPAGQIDAWVPHGGVGGQRATRLQHVDVADDLLTHQPLLQHTDRDQMPAPFGRIVRRRRSDGTGRLST